MKWAENGRNPIFFGFVTVPDRRCTLLRVKITSIGVTPCCGADCCVLRRGAHVSFPLRIGVDERQQGALSLLVEGGKTETQRNLFLICIASATSSFV